MEITKSQSKNYYSISNLLYVYFDEDYREERLKEIFYFIYSLQ